MIITQKNLRWHRNKSCAKDNIGHIYLTNNKGKEIGIALVDKEELLRCVLTLKWHLCKKTKNVINTKNAISLGRYILRVDETKYSDYFVFHYNNNPLDCRKNNLFLDVFDNQARM